MGVVGSDATHIFDGINTFPTHIAHMRDGRFVSEPTAWTGDVEGTVTTAAGSTIHALALRWLRQDREHRVALEKGGDKRRTRGARVTVSTRGNEHGLWPIDACAGRADGLGDVLQEVRLRRALGTVIIISSDSGLVVTHYKSTE